MAAVTGCGLFTLGGYTGRWNSTDQVPKRAFNSGQISRFGNIDPNLG